MTAAPLKLVDLRKAGVDFRWFPRLNDRGPIEAPTQPLERRALTRFPRLNDRGPIEACVATWNNAFARSSFPRLNDRGPIEARIRRSVFFDSRGGFRG